MHAKNGANHTKMKTIKGLECNLTKLSTTQQLGAFTVRRSLLLIFSWILPLFTIAALERYKSPSGRYSICNADYRPRAEAYFEIRTAGGDVLFSSKDDPSNSLGLDRRFFSGSYADDIIWSPDEQFALFTFYDGKYKVTVIYSFTARKLISLGHVTDGWTVPIRWVSSRTFVVEHHWPMGGKARSQTRYRETYRVHMNPFTLDCVYKGAKTQDKEPEDET